MVHQYSSPSFSYSDSSGSSEYKPKKRRKNKTFKNKRQKLQIPLTESNMDKESSEDEEITKIDNEVSRRYITKKEIANSNKSFNEKVVMFEWLYALEADPNNFELKQKLNDKLNEKTNRTDDDTKSIMLMRESAGFSDDIQYTILKSNHSEYFKRILFRRYIEYEHQSDHDNGSALEWIQRALLIPHNNPQEIPTNKTIKSNLLKMHEFMNQQLYGQTIAKERILEIYSSMSKTKKIIALVGSPGTGKTSFAHIISKTINKPIYQISLGGSKDSSFLKGHRITYTGSAPGEIYNAIVNMNSLDGIIFFDELDKIKDTPHGQEVSSTLLHILDYSQNKEFKDDYFPDIPIDLSNIMFVLSLNNIETIDRVLLDRLHLINFEDYTIDDKINISMDYIIPKIKKDLELCGVVIEKDVVKYIINKSITSKNESGVRQLERNIQMIFERINTMKYIEPNKIKLSYYIHEIKQGLTKNNKITLNKNHIDILFYEAK